MSISIERLKEISESVADGNVSIDYILDNDVADRPFDSYHLSTDENIQGTIAGQIKKRIQNVNESKVVDYDFTKELSSGQVGRMDIGNCPIRLSQMISASNQPNRNSFKFNKKNRDRVVAYATSIQIVHNKKDTQLKVFKKLNLSSILSKNKRKAQVGLIKGEVKGIPEDLVIMSPEAMDVVTVEDTAFIFNESNFHFLFSGTEFLKNEIEKNISIVQAVLEDSEKLINYAYKNPSVLRGVYHLVTAGKKISIDQKKVQEIEHRIQSVNGTSTQIFEFNASGNLICTDTNVQYIYWLLAKRYGLSIVDDKLLILGSTYPLR